MLIVHRAERADRLIAPLTEVLSAIPSDTFAREIIAVPSRGVERWLAQQLSLSLGSAGAKDGVAANIEFPSPNSLVSDVLAGAVGITAEDDPWVGSRLIWALLEVIDASTAEPWTAVLAHHLGLDSGGDEHRSGRRYATAALLARLFTSYGDNRPTMLADWAGDRDTDGAGVALSDDLSWQPALWRRLRGHLAVPSPTERLDDARAALRDNPSSAKLPDRLSLFGPTRLSRIQLQVLAALAEQRELHLWLTHPSPALWDLLARAEPAARRRADRSALKVSNTLLANLSRDVRELQQRLPEGFEDRHYPAESLPGTVLGRIQDDVTHDRPAGSQARLPVDDTVLIHACHGPTRQVEVLREQLLHLLDADDTLQPRDIIVLCPDVETFAPLIAAAFAAPEASHPGHQIRVRLADRGLTQTNPLLDTIATLVALADGRASASEVLDLAATVPVAHQFRFTSPELEVLRRWTVEGGARWGLWQREREHFGLASITQNTFAAARDRVLLGVAADESELGWLGGALPLDDVDSGDVDLAGRFTEYLERIDAALTQLAGPQSPPQWQQALENALDLLTASADADGWQRPHAARRISEAIKGSGERDIALADLRDVLADVVAARPTRANFRTGDLTVATLVPMRFVPHRVVAVIGVDDGHFPRVGHLTGDDVLSIDPCVGERDPRSEDRQLLLDALMSATDRVVICYTGADPVTGKRLPPVAPLADVIDAVTATVEDGANVVRRQPLQPHDPANFAAAQPFSHDRQNFAAAREVLHGPGPRPPMLPAPLAAVPATDVSLEDLVTFVTDPAKAFLRQRLGVSLWRADDQFNDALPLASDPLGNWKIGDRLLARILAEPGEDTVDRFVTVEQRRGTLPPGPAGRAAMAGIEAAATMLARAATTVIGAEQHRTHQISLDLGEVRLTGTVTGVFGARLLNASYSRLKTAHKLTSWVRLLALAASGYPVTEVVTLGRSGSGDNPGVSRSTISVPADAAALLGQLLELRDAGLRYPLPIATESSFAYAEQRLADPPGDGFRAASKRWWDPTVTYRPNNEKDDEALVCVYGPDAPFSALWDQPAPGRFQWFDEPNWFAQLAIRLWMPVLECTR